MNAHDDSRFAAYVLGLLPSVEQGEVAAHVSACPRCAAALQGVAEALHALPLTLPPQPPPADGLAHVLAAARADAAGPFGAFVTRVAHLFDVGVERAREMLAGLGDPVGWVTGGEGIWLLHLQGGPRTVGADAGLVRMAPGARFPRHRHTGTEFAVILQGGYQDEDGRVYRAGDEPTQPAGSEHDFVALPDEECLFAAVVLGGIQPA